MYREGFFVLVCGFEILIHRVAQFPMLTEALEAILKFLYVLHHRYARNDELKRATVSDSPGAYYRAGN